MTVNYDRIAGIYDGIGLAWNAVIARSAVHQYRTLVRQHVRPGAMVLDVGVGTGLSSEILLKEANPGMIVGADLSSAMLARARERLVDPRVGLVCADARNLPFPDDKFDVVLTMWLLEIVPDPTGVVEELLRVVRPEGIVIAIFSTLPRGPLARIGIQLLERVERPWFGAHFLAAPEQPFHDCPVIGLHRYPDALATVVTYGKG